MLSYNQIIKLNKEFAEAHMVLKSFGNGEVYKVVKHSQQDWFSYPLMWMEDLPNPVNDKEYTYTFRVYFIQQVPPLKDRESDQLTANYDEAKSDMISCARDLLAFWAKDSDYSDLDLIKNTVITTFEDDWGDLVTGCYVDLKLKQAFKYNKCAIPMTGITPPPSEGCQDANLNINATSYGTIASGGTLNLEVRDTENTLVGFNDGGVWRVPAGITTERAYITPRYSGAVSAGANDANGSVYWRKANEIGKRTQAEDVKMMRPLFGSTHLLDTINGPDNVFGNNYILTGTTGGYYDPTDGNYYDVSGTLTTRSGAFPDDIGINHLIGYLVQMTQSGARTWYDWCAYGLSLTQGGFTGWYLPSVTEIVYFGNWGETLGYTNNSPLDWRSGLKLLGDNYQVNNTQCMVIQSYNHITSSPKLNNNKAVLIKPDVDINLIFG